LENLRLSSSFYLRLPSSFTFVPIKTKVQSNEMDQAVIDMMHGSRSG